MNKLLFVLLILISNSSFGEGYSSNLEAEKDAIRSAAEACYKQTGIEKNLTEYAQRQIPNKYKPILSRATMFTRVLVSQKLEMKWTF